MTTFRLSLCSVLLMGTLSLSAQPMSYDAMRDNARYLTDRMAYTLGLGDPLLDDLYCINYDYICGVNDYLDDVAVGYRYDDYNLVLAARDAALMALLTPAQWTALITIDYFYRPIVFASRRWYFGIYRHLPFTGHWYFRQPAHYPSYRGGRFFGGMNPGGGHAPGYQMRRQQPNNRAGNVGGAGNRGNNSGNGYRIGGSSRGNDNGSNRGTYNNNGNAGSSYSGRTSSSDNASSSHRSSSRNNGTSGRSSSSSTKSSTSVKSNARSVGSSAQTTTGARTGKLNTNSGSLSKSSNSSRSSSSSARKSSGRTSSSKASTSKSSSAGRSGSRSSSGGGSRESK